MDRRKFIINTSVATGGILSAPYIAKGENVFKLMTNQQLGFDESDNIMIIIELFGGNDGLNTIIPLGDGQQSKYYDLRQEIAIAESDAIKVADSSVYLHPALVTNVRNDGIAGLIDQGKLGIVEGVGYQNPTLSHFRSRDIWHSGIISNDPQEKLLEGWLGRYFARKLENFPSEIPEHPIAIAMVGKIPLLLQSNKGHMGIALNNPESFTGIGNEIMPSLPLLDDNSNFADEYNFVHTIAKQSAVYRNAVGQAWQNGINAVEYSHERSENRFISRVGQQLQSVARLISGGLKSKVYYVGLSNFDSHVQQRNQFDPLDGQHPELLADLAHGISDFMEDMTIQGHSERVAGMTFSEFGRRSHSNGSRGTDHGAASNLFVFGHNDYLLGSRFGNAPDLNNLDNNQNIRSRPEEDFRRVYADFLTYWFGATQIEVDQIFNEEVDPIDILRPRTTSVVESIVGGKENGLKIYPNPSKGSGFIEFELTKRSKVELLIYSLDGKLQFRLLDSSLEPNVYKERFFVNAIGNYTAVLVVNGRRYPKTLNVVK